MRRERLGKIFMVNIERGKTNHVVFFLGSVRVHRIQKLIAWLSKQASWNTYRGALTLE